VRFCYFWKPPVFCRLSFPSIGGVDSTERRRRGGRQEKTQTMKEILTHVNGVPIRRNFVENLPFNPQLIVLLKEKRKAGILGEVI